MFKFNKKLTYSSRYLSISFSITGGYRGRGGSYNHQYSGDRTFNRGQSNFYGGK